MNACHSSFPAYSTLKEVVNVVSMGDFSFVQNLYEEKKIDFLSKVPYNMYRASSLISLSTTSRGDIFLGGNPFKRETLGRVSVKI